MRVRLSPRASAITWFLCLAWIQLAAAQEPSLRGTVASAETGYPLGFSVVTLHPNIGRQFTDAAGAFAFANTKAGTYLLSVRQIGYAPLDTQVVITGDSAPIVRIALRRLAIELPPVTIAGQQCTRPGRPDSSNAPLLAVFDQLQENSLRFELLAGSYPFEYTLELSNRNVSQRGDTGRPIVRRLRFSSTDDHPYAVGNVVEPSWGPWGNDGSVIHTADLRDFGNPSFVENHCFHLVGRDTIAGETLVRIDFEPATHIWSADMVGAAYLDSITYELRYTETSLTRPERSEMPDVRAVNVRTRFHNIAPGVPLQESLSAIWTYRSRRKVVETQRTVDVHFRRQPPPP